MEEAGPGGTCESDDPKAIVRRGYDVLAHRYLTWTSSKKTPRLTYLDLLLSHMIDSSDARILELGSGAGVPTTRLLAERCHEVVANDISPVQVDLARANVPYTNVSFIVDEMTKISFPPESFHAVVAFYSIIHLPREEQRGMFDQSFAWLAPGGHLVCNLGTNDDAGTTSTWLGTQTTMYWSGFDANTAEQLIQRAGFTLVSRQVMNDDEDGKLVPFLWILAQKT